MYFPNICKYIFILNYCTGNIIINSMSYTWFHIINIPYMNTTTHGCDYEGPCKIRTVLLLKSRFLMLGPEASRVDVCSGRSGKTKYLVHKVNKSSKFFSRKLATLFEPLCTPNNF